MKEMALENENKQDRLEQVLADSEQILNRVNTCLDRIDERQNKMKETMKVIDGLQCLIEWKIEKEEG